MNVLDLFSGIGGFSLGLERAGMRTVAFCESDEYCRAVLAKHWPAVPCFDDIHTIDARGLGRLGSIDIVCGGFPCQPFSVAGKQKGKKDDRHLWPEMLRIIALARPAWVIGENVAGLVAMALDDVLADLENIGYTARTFTIPACAVGAPHRRDRLWIVANAGRERRQQIASGAYGDETQDEGRTEAETDESTSRSEDATDSASMQRGTLKRDESNGALQCIEDVADATCELLNWRRPGAQETRRRESTNSGWWSAEPNVGRVAHGIPKRVDRLRCLGNAVVPQIPEIIGRAIMRIEHGQ